MRKIPSSIHRSYGPQNLPPIMLQRDQINDANDQLYNLPQIPVVDFATLPVIVAVLLLSVLSLSFIFQLRLRSRSAGQLREFNNLWTVRVLLVLFISYWAINEISRLQFFRRRYLFPFVPSLTLSQQDDLCKFHVVFSLGFLEPGFLITLLFIIHESVKKRNRSEIWAVLSVFLMTLPTLVLQIIFIFFVPLKKKLPPMMIRSSFLSVDGLGNKSMTCSFPLLSSIIFGAFMVVYSLGLVVYCWRVVSMVINKNVRLRIKLLGMTVIISLLLQTVCLAAAGLWAPQKMEYGAVLLGLFVSVAVCAGLAEIVLVIKPILEALAVGGDYCEWNPIVRYLQQVEGRRL